MRLAVCINYHSNCEPKLFWSFSRRWESSITSTKWNAAITAADALRQAQGAGRFPLSRWLSLSKPLAIDTPLRQEDVGMGDKKV